MKISTTMQASSKSTDYSNIGDHLYQLLEQLFPICRSITGNGVRETFYILKKHIPLIVHEVPSGTSALDWTVPDEWNISNAFIQGEDGRKIIEFRENNLHVVGYSTPIDQWVSCTELQNHLHSLEDMPDAIPYVTSYYEKYWGFCLSHNDRQELKKDQKYRVVIESELKPGHMTYGEYIIPGKTDKEVFISTYICHPSMANNELSGPVVAAYIAKWIASLPRKYTYRIIFIPETIGAITYLSKHREALRDKVLAGFNISCVGDDRTYSFVSSRYGNSLADKVAANVLHFKHPSFTRYSFLERGSDERQYCSPGVDLPLVTLCRSKFATYPEYHTSLDNLSLVTPSGLKGGYEMVKECIEVLECNVNYRVTCYGEPQLGKRGFYPNRGTKGAGKSARSVTNLIAYADGTNDLVDISNLIGKPVCEIRPIAEELVNAGILEECI